MQNPGAVSGPSARIARKREVAVHVTSIRGDGAGFWSLSDAAGLAFRVLGMPREGRNAPGVAGAFVPLCSAHDSGGCGGRGVRARLGDPPADELHTNPEARDQHQHAREHGRVDRQRHLADQYGQRE
jgi:hypothetical protein